MATTYRYPDNTAWVESALVGPQTLQVQGQEVLVHFGPTLPIAYDGYPHIHLTQDDDIYHYTGAEKVFFRTANNNVSGITQTSKIACTITVY